MDTAAFVSPVPVPSVSSGLLDGRQSSCASRRPSLSTSFIPRRASTVHSPPSTSSRTADAAHFVRMALSNVVIAGGTGFVGARIASQLTSQGVSVTVLTRNASSPVARSLPRGARPVSWSPGRTPGSAQNGWADALRGADAVINLCGEPIVTRWSDYTKAKLLSSRLQPTEALVAAIGQLPAAERPKCLINASAVGFYGSDGPYDTVLDERSAVGNDFLANLCTKWEAAARPAEALGTRVVLMRLGIVLGPNGGALGKMVPAFKLFVGGPLGSGRQWVSWVHVDDVASAFAKAAADESMSGVYNITAPKPVTMGAMCDSLGRALGRPNLFVVPEFVIKLGLGEASCVLVEGQNVSPKRLQDGGFSFTYPDIDSAMRQIVTEV